MRAAEVLTLLGLIGGLGGVATPVTAWPTVRKMRAEVTALRREVEVSRTRPRGTSPVGPSSRPEEAPMSEQYPDPRR